MISVREVIKMVTSLFQTLLPFTNKTKKYSRTRHHWEILECVDEAEEPPCNSEIKKVCIRRGREVTKCRLHCPYPKNAQHCAEFSPESSVPAVGKENPRRTTSFPSIGITLWEPLLWSPTMGIAGESVRLNHWESDCDEEEGRSLQQPAPNKQLYWCSGSFSHYAQGRNIIFSPTHSWIGSSACLSREPNQSTWEAVYSIPQSYTQWHLNTDHSPWLPTSAEQNKRLHMTREFS